MARKLNIPKDKQIAGLRKAIANRKTPRGFIPSMKKRLAKLTGAAAILFLLCGCAVRPVAAQAPVTIVSTQQILAPAGTACTGLPQIFPINNRNQTQHYAYIRSNAAVTNLVMQIQGIDASGNVYVISDTSSTAIPVVGNNSSLPASGYFPTVQVSVTCLPASTGTFSLNYSGSQATFNTNVGSYLISQQDKTIASLAPANTTYTPNVSQTPYGNSYGMIYFQFQATGPAGSTLQVICQTQNGTGPSSLIYTLATSNAQQMFPIPANPCPNYSINYISGGASATTYLLDYVFMQPGTILNNSYTHIVGTTATAVKAGPGIVHSIVIGTSAAGTISLFDLAPAACTGTPATNVVSVITEFASATPPPPSYIFDVAFNNGICLKASAVMDITVASQ